MLPDRRRTFGGALLAGTLAAAACGDAAEEPAGPSPEKPAAEGWFVDVTAACGVDFRHRHCGAGDKHLIEMNGGAVAVIDHDGDGIFDLFYPQSVPLPGFDATGVDLRDRMYRGTADGRYVDVTDAAHCDDGEYSYSASVADVDGDGDPDLLLSNLGCNRLLRNDGGRFTDVTEAAGVGDREWTSCTAFADYDQDGDLDFYVGNYVVYDLAHPIVCGDISRGPQYRSYCHPDQFPGEQDHFFRNDGEGRFTDVTEAAGMTKSRGKALGLLTSDFDQDGDVDLFVANDSTPRFLWRNEGGLHFTEVGYESSVALSARGLSQASMGTDGADIDRDGDVDVVFTNLAQDYNTILRNDGGGFFSDRSYETGVAEPSLPWVGFGARFFDLELDGDEDLMVVNGHVVDNIELYRRGESFEQPAQLFTNDGKGHFRVVGPEAGRYFQELRVGRALATYDKDDDGDLDLLVVDNDGPARILENRVPRQGHWLGLTLRGRPGNPTAIGARAEVFLDDSPVPLLRESRGSSSYNASGDPRLHFGLGSATKVPRLRITWPTGAVLERTGLEVDRYHEFVE